MRPLPPLTLCLLLALPTAARAEKFRYKYRAGQVVQSRAGMAGASLVGPTTGDPLKMQFRVSIKQTARVLSVKGGVVTLQVTDTPISGKMMAMGESQALDRPPTRAVVRLTERGKFLSRKEIPSGGAMEAELELAGGPGDDMAAAEALFGLNFPDRDLKPGDTWQDTLTVGPRESPLKVTMTGRYVGHETFRGRKCAKFVTTVTHGSGNDETTGGVRGELGLPSSGRFTATLTTYFDPAAGVDVYSTGSMISTSRTDLSALNPEGGEIVSATKINVVQYLTPAAGSRK